MKQKLFLAATVLAAAMGLAACGGSSAPASPYPSHNGAYDTTASLAKESDWGHSYGSAEKLLGKKVSYTYTEQIEVKVDAHGGTSDFSKFRVKTNVKTEGYFDFSATDFYGYVKTTYADANNPSTDYVKEALIRKAADGTYEYITTDHTEYIPLGTVYAAFGATFNINAMVANTKASHLDWAAFSEQGCGTTNEWLWKTVGLSSTASSGVEDWEDVKPTYGTSADGSLVGKCVAPVVGYTTDQGVSDFGFGKEAAYVQWKVGTDGYLTDWAVDYNGDNASLDFKIMTPAPTVIVTGGRSFSANYSATAQEHKTDIEHAQPAAKKYATWSVTPDNGVASYTVTRMIIQGQTPTGMADITLAGKDEIVDNLWFAVKPTLVSGAAISSVKVNDADALLMNGFYCVKADQEKDFAFTITTDASVEGKATMNIVKDAGIAEALPKYLTVPAVTTIIDVPDGGIDAGASQYFVCKPTLADGKEIDKVLCNGKDITASAAGFGGYYGINAKDAGLYQFTFLTK